MTIVGFGHVARVGKDAAAAALVEHLGYRRVGFADALKRHALAVNPVIDRFTATRLWDIVQEWGWESAKDQLPEIRRYLEAEGDACRATFGPDCWLDLLPLAGVGGCENVVIPDVRYPNEASWIQRNGGVVIRIDRPGCVPTHPSEHHLADWDGWDGVIHNTGTLEDLHALVVTGWWVP